MLFDRISTEIMMDTANIIKPAANVTVTGKTREVFLRTIDESIIIQKLSIRKLANSEPAVMPSIMAGISPSTHCKIICVEV